MFFYETLDMQVSIARSSNGQLQARLTNAAGFPQACFYQV
jgi:hypothetical protein